MINNKLSAITLNGNTTVYLNEVIIYKCATTKWPFYEKVCIKSVDKQKLLEVVIIGFFGLRRKYTIKENNLLCNLKIELVSKKVFFVVNGKEITFEKKKRAWKFEGDFYMDGVLIGSIQNKLTFFQSKLVYEFIQDDEMNYFCVFLSAILIRNEFNTISS